MYEIDMKRIEHMRLRDMGGLGIDLARADYYEYRWWEFELHITLGVHYITVRIRKHV